VIDSAQATFTRHIGHDRHSRSAQARLFQVEVANNSKLVGSHLIPDPGMTSDVHVPTAWVIQRHVFDSVNGPKRIPLSLWCALRPSMLGISSVGRERDGLSPTLTNDVSAVLLKIVYNVAGTKSVRGGNARNNIHHICRLPALTDDRRCSLHRGSVVEHDSRILAPPRSALSDPTRLPLAAGMSALPLFRQCLLLGLPPDSLTHSIPPASLVAVSRSTA
jgi:hypothetical protein